MSLAQIPSRELMANGGMLLRRVGQRIEPCELLTIIQNDLEEWPFKTTFINRFDKKD